MPVSLNVDLGELPDEPEELYRIATQVNIACGGHAGDAASMARAVDLAVSSGANIAAHPSYPDRAGFGRTTLSIAPADLGRAVGEQCRTLRGIASAARGRVAVVKPHGALYHDLGKDPALATAFLDGVVAALGKDLAIVGFPGSPFEARVVARGMTWIGEGFADRGYDEDGALLARTRPGALILSPDDAARQALALSNERRIGTVCVHGDTPGAVAIARAVRAELESAGALA